MFLARLGHRRGLVEGGQPLGGGVEAETPGEQNLGISTPPTNHKGTIVIEVETKSTDTDIYL